MHLLQTYQPERYSENRILLSGQVHKLARCRLHFQNKGTLISWLDLAPKSTWLRLGKDVMLPSLINLVVTHFGMRIKVAVL